MSITRRSYRALCDFPAVYDFMAENYSRDWKNGPAAPLFEYALLHSYHNDIATYRNAIWEEDGKIVAYAGYEMRPGEPFFVLPEKYGFLAPELISYAEENLRAADGSLEFELWNGQTALRDELSRRGYKLDDDWPTAYYDYRDGALDYKLPAGYHFLDPEKEGFDCLKHQLCTFRGFNHEEKGETFERNDDEILRYTAAPHHTGLDVTVVDDASGDYVCYAGMWTLPSAGLAYLEPLCTVPAHRRRGLAAAAISELYRRTSALGLDHMSGGGDAFYYKIGFKTWYTNEVWTKE